VVEENFFFSLLLPVTQASEHTNEQKEEKKKWRILVGRLEARIGEKCNLIIVV
jgi:hypothetical protein